MPPFPTDEYKTTVLELLVRIRAAKQNWTVDFGSSTDTVEDWEWHLAIASHWSPALYEFERAIVDLRTAHPVLLASIDPDRERVEMAGRLLNSKRNPTRTPKEQVDHYCAYALEMTRLKIDIIMNITSVLWIPLVQLFVVSSPLVIWDSSMDETAATREEMMRHTAHTTRTLIHQHNQHFALPHDWVGIRYRLVVAGASKETLDAAVGTFAGRVLLAELRKMYLTIIDRDADVRGKLALVKCLWVEFEPALRHSGLPVQVRKDPAYVAATGFMASYNPNAE
jgi:hypothetical protein